MKSLLIGVSIVTMCCLSCLAGSNSGTSSLLKNIKFPTNPPDSIKNGGYSICLERVDSDDSSCTRGMLIHKKISDDAVDLDLKRGCAKGYKLKMWLWGDSSSHKPLYGINPKKSGSSYTYTDGYVIIDEEKLKQSTISLSMNFLPTSDASSSSSSSSSSSTGTEDWESLISELMNGSSSGSSNSSSSSGSDSSSSDKVTVSTTCNNEGNVQDDAKDSGSGEAPTGSIISLGTKAPDIKASSYPSMVMYTFTSQCAPCEQLKSWAQSSQSTFKGKIHVYQNDVPYGGVTDGGAQNCSNNTARPVVEFYDKSGSKTSDCVVGFDQSAITSAIQKLSN